MFTVLDSETGQPVSDHQTFAAACASLVHYQGRSKRNAHVSTTKVTLTRDGFKVSA